MRLREIEGHEVPHEKRAIHRYMAIDTFLSLFLTMVRCATFEAHGWELDSPEG